MSARPLSPLPLRFGALALALALLATSTAEAQPRSYARVLREAIGEFERGNFEEARALFLDAFELEPSARLLRGAGMASFELREYVTAHRQLRQALDEERRALTDAQRAETEELLARTETFLGRFRFVVEPEDAELTIDLRVPEPEPDGTVLLDVGEHVVAAQAEGHLPTDRRIVVAGGEEETITLALEPEAPPADGTPPPPPPEGLDRLSRGLLIGGASFAVAGLGAFGWWIERRKEAARCADASGDGGTCLNGATLDAQARGAGVPVWLRPDPARR